MFRIGIHQRIDDLPFLGLLVALAAGLIFPEWFISTHGLTLFLLQFIFFISGLRIDLATILSEFRDVKLLMVVGLLRLVVFPIFVAGLAKIFFPELMAPLVLLSAMPAGMTSPLFVDMIRGNVALSLFVTAGTSVLSVLSLPFILSLLGSATTTFGAGMIFQTLFLAMILPLFLAQLVRLFSSGRGFIQQSRWITRAASVIALWLLIATIASKHSADILSGIMSGHSIRALFIMSGLLILFHFACYGACFWRRKKDRLTVTLSLSYMNFTLAIFLAETIFHEPGAMMVIILSMLPWNIGLLLFQWFVRRQGWMLPELSEEKGSLLRASVY